MKGTVIVLNGTSSSGKTTLGRAILGANKISSGNVIFHDDEKDYVFLGLFRLFLPEVHVCFDPCEPI